MSRFNNLNPFEIHKRLINEYMLKKPGDTSTIFKRDTSKDKCDLDVIRENHRFLWDDNDDGLADASWEKQLARKYYDKLFKEYCICDLGRYKENKVALRWRIEAEVISGKGQFICGNKICSDENELKSWEVNFGYQEHGERKNALIKVRLCLSCSRKLNYHSVKREVKRFRKTKRKKSKNDKKSIRNKETNTTSGQSTSSNQSLQEHSQSSDASEEEGADCITASKSEDKKQQSETECWNKAPSHEEKNREEEFDEYLEDLLL